MSADAEAGAAFGRMVQLRHRFIDHEHEEIRQLNAGRDSEPLAERRRRVVAAGSNGQVEGLVDLVTACAVEESRFQCGPQGAGCCVLAWGGHRAPASGYG